MDNIIEEFKTAFIHQNEELQKEISENILQFLINQKNAKLFEEINQDIQEYINDFKKDLFDFCELFASMSEDEKKNIIQLLDEETNKYEFTFVSHNVGYMCEIKLEIRFNHFEYTYNYHGTTDGEGNATHNYTFEESTNKKWLELIFDIQHIREMAHSWMCDYTQI